MGMSEEVLSGSSLFPREFEEISHRCATLRSAKTTGDLGNLLATAVTKFTIFDLQVIGGRMREEIRKLPSPYREAVSPYFTEQVFGMHHRLIAQYRDGEFDRMESPITTRDLFDAFWEMVPVGCFSWDDGSEKRLTLYNPLHRFFYYLISAYTMFVLGLPGHPVGMPFPGSFWVEEKNGSYNCPIRDKEKDVFFSICNFCPARQMEILIPEIRKKSEFHEVL